MSSPVGNVFYYGENLAVLRPHVPGELVDLIYLDSSSDVTGNARCSLAECRGIQQSQRSMTSLA